VTQDLYLYDTTLRDGGQTRGVNFSAKDKHRVSSWLDRLGVAYVEGGWPGANPVDDEFFAEPPVLKNAKLAAFGMTRRSKIRVEEDASIQTLSASKASSVALVGKTWDFHATHALGVSLDENLRMIGDSVAFVSGNKKEVLFDAEHFFDGFKANKDYALSCLSAAHDAGASWLVLCDTNGGTLPYEVDSIVQEVKEELPEAPLGIHCHNDTGNAVANSIMAVRAGCKMVQATLGGLGERCGNADLLTLIPTLHYKMGYDVGVSDKACANLVKISNSFAALLDRDVPSNAAYVGKSAFAHKGGLHVRGVDCNEKTYEHMSPELVGNQRDVIISDQAGLSNLRHQLRELGIVVADNDPALKALLKKVKQTGQEGFSYDYAVASFALMSLRSLGRAPNFFSVKSCEINNRGSGDLNRIFSMTSHASIKLQIGDNTREAVAEGVGPVNALDAALRLALNGTYPVIKDIKLTDYHVRILDTKAATAATTRVLLESKNTKSMSSWVTIGASPNVINASLQALCDSYEYGILMENAKNRTAMPERHGSMRKESSSTATGAHP